MDGLRRVEAQHVDGYPTAGQFEFYLGTPALVLVVCLLASVLIIRTRWVGMGTAILVAALLMVLPFGCLYTGGI